MKRSFLKIESQYERRKSLAEIRIARPVLVTAFFAGQGGDFDVSA
jgi:hypothetical protein